MSRDLIEVVKAMIEVVPQTEESVLSSLDDFISSVEYAAAVPERIAFWWKKVANFLHETFPGPANLKDWQQSVVNIWMGRGKKPVEGWVACNDKTIKQVLRDRGNGMSHGEIMCKYPSLIFEEVYAIIAGGEYLTIKEIEARLPNIHHGMAGIEILCTVRESEKTEK